MQIQPTVLIKMLPESIEAVRLTPGRSAYLGGPPDGLRGDEKGAISANSKHFTPVV